MIEEAKPHCGLSPSRSIGIYRPASAMRCAKTSNDSSAGSLVLINPRMTNLSSGTSLSGAKEPELPSSYSNSSVCSFVSVNNSRWIEPYLTSDRHRLPLTRKRYFGNLVRFALQIGKFVCRQITKTLQFCDGAEPSWPACSLHALLVVPLAPKKSVEIKFTEAANGSRHLALKRLPAHLAVGHDFQADALLQSDSVIDGPVFDQFEFSSSDGSSDEFLLSRKQLRWA